MSGPRLIGDDLWQAMPDGNEKRQLYYCSREWSERKEAVKKRSGGWCERCHGAEAENVHHRTYQRLYAELLSDLWHICRECHEFLHAHADRDPLIDHAQRMASEHSLTIQPDDNRSLIVCPFCGNLNCHMGKPRDGSSMETCNNQGCIVIPMSGECIHEWDIVLAGHKGTLHAFILNGRERSDD